MRNRPNQPRIIFGILVGYEIHFAESSHKSVLLFTPLEAINLSMAFIHGSEGSGLGDIGSTSQMNPMIWGPTEVRPEAVDT